MIGSDDDLAPRVATMVRARLLSSAIDTGLAIALIRVLPKDEFAVLGVAFVVYELAKQLAVGGFADSLLVLLPTAREGARRRIALRTARLLIATGAFAGVVMLSMSALLSLGLPHWQAEDRALLARVLHGFAAAALFEFPSLPLTQLLLALNHQRLAGRWEVITSLASLSALLGPIALGLGVAGAAWTIAAWAALRALISLGIAHTVLPTDTEAPSPRSFRDQLGFALPLGLHTLVTRLSKHADKLIVTLLLPSSAFAEYAAASHELPFVTVFPYVVGSVLVSRYAVAFDEADPSRAAALWHRGVRKVSLAVVPAAVWSIVAAPDLIRVAFGDKYLGAVVPFQIYSITLLTRVAQFGALLQAARDTRAILRFSLATVATNTALGLSLTPLLGIAGTATATLLANLFGISLYLRRIARHLALPASEVMPWRHWLRTLAMSGTAGAVTWIVRDSVGIRDAVLGIALDVGCFLALLVALYRAAALWGPGETRVLRLLLLGPRARVRDAAR